MPASPLAYRAGSASNLALHPVLQNKYVFPKCVERCSDAAVTAMPHTGSRVAASGCEWLEDPPASSLPAWLA